jgi:ATP-dependent exoDNAse (exonuclease V) alpha subunit
LTEAGVLSRTVASLLENPHIEWQRKEFWIIDESSLLATRQVNQLLHLAKDEGIERIVFVGDQRQHHAIEAGRPVYQMQQAGMTIASLNVIRRQRDPELRRAVELASAGKAAEVIETLRQQGRITQIAPAADLPGNRGRLSALIRGWPADVGGKPCQRGATRTQPDNPGFVG